MKNTGFAVRGAAWIAVALVAFFLLGAPAPARAGTVYEAGFTRAELAQLLAPIALYPDSLLAQVLMASTYPLEVVEAERWLRRSQGLEGDGLYRALLEKDWDTSVKSLCNFPDVLFALSDDIGRTRRLGDAFLAGEKEVMDVVQELRRQAREQGSLRTTREQKVIVESRIIRIEPAVSHVVYVPVYDPGYVYGAWLYPAYPPYCWRYPSGFSVSARYLAFDPPVFISIGWFSWASFDWPAFQISIIFSYANRYHRRYVRVDDHDDHYWYHDPRHRDGVDYRDRETRDRFRPSPSPVVFRDPPPREPAPPQPPKDRDTGWRDRPDWTEVVAGPSEGRDNDRDTGRRDRPGRTEVVTAPPDDRRPERPAPVIVDTDLGQDRSGERVTDRGRGGEVRVSRGGGPEEVFEGRSGRGGSSPEPAAPSAPSRGRDDGPGRGRGRDGDDRR